jgi:hypothetical protein
VLEALRDWAGSRFASLDEPLPSGEKYLLEGMEFHA